jgi:hypothetical protein
MAHSPPLEQAIPGRGLARFLGPFVPACRPFRNRSSAGCCGGRTMASGPPFRPHPSRLATNKPRPSLALPRLVPAPSTCAIIRQSTSAAAPIVANSDLQRAHDAKNRSSEREKAPRRRILCPSFRIELRLKMRFKVLILLDKTTKFPVLVAVAFRQQFHLESPRSFSVHNLATSTP